MRDLFCSAYAEDAPSCAVIEKLVEFQNAHTSETVLRLTAGFPENKRGSGNLKKIIPKISNLVKAGSAVIIVTDLDTMECAPELIRNWFSTPVVSKHLLFRVAVREMESWLIADRKALARFLNIPVANFSHDPDSLDDPKAHLLGIIRSKGRTNRCREMLPNRNARIGPEYNPVLCEFVRKHWIPERASENSLSLRRALAKFRAI